MDVAQLLEPVLTGGIKDTYFFNGRMLTADDLRTMQVASRQHDAQLGRAIGDGVAYGLEVSLAAGTTASALSAVLHVAKGLAINRMGDRAALPGGVDVAIVPSETEAEEAEGLFTVCVPVTQTLNTNLGLYLLTIAPSSGYEGRAPMTELGTEGVAGKCGSRYAVEGVKFDCRAISLPGGDASARVEARALFTTLQTQLPSLAAGAISPELFKLRNIAAHLLFGSEVEEDDWADALRPEDDETPRGWLQELRAQKQLSDCEVPLALIYWSIRGIEFVDMWAVRRRVSLSRYPYNPTTWLVAPRRTAIGEARFRQFQDQIEALRVAHPSPQTLPAATYFRYLPPAGVLRVSGGATGKVFNHELFLPPVVYRDPVFIEGARLEPMLRASFEYPAFDLTDPSMLWLYAARENTQEIADGDAEVPAAYLAFATGHMPFYGLPRFDVSQWDYANYPAFEEGIFV